jgi:hypothetical protein
MAARRRFVPDFDPSFGDRALADALHDIVIGRWQGVRDLLRATGDDWPLRTHRLRLLAHAAAGSSAVENWRAAEPADPDAAVLRAATEVVRVFHQAIEAGHGAPLPRPGSMRPWSPACAPPRPARPTPCRGCRC